jgi:hypothetical protein
MKARLHGPFLFLIKYTLCPKVYIPNYSFYYPNGLKFEPSKTLIKDEI